MTVATVTLTLHTIVNSCHFKGTVMSGSQSVFRIGIFVLTENVRWFSVITINLTISPDTVPQGDDSSLQCQVGGANVASYRFYAGGSQLCSYDVTTSTGQCEDSRHSVLRGVMQITSAQLYEATTYTCQASTSDGKRLTSSPAPLTVIPRKKGILRIVLLTIFKRKVIPSSLV